MDFYVKSDAVNSKIKRKNEVFIGFTYKLKLIFYMLFTTVKFRSEGKGKIEKIRKDNQKS